MTDRFSPPNLVAIGLVLVFVSAVALAITGGLRFNLLPFGAQSRPIDFVLPLGIVGGLACIIGGLARILTD